MKNTAIIAVSAALAAGSAFAQDEPDRTGWPSSFAVATASQGGTYFTYGSGWANLVAEELGVSGSGEVTGGPMQNMANVHTGQNAFGQTTLGPAADSIAGQNPIAPGVAMDGACAIFPMYETAFTITVLESTGIATVADIPEGSRVGFGPAGGTADTYLPQILEMLGITFERRNGGYGDLGGQLQDGLIDVLAFAAGVPTPVISQLEAQTDITIMGFTEAEKAQIIEAFPVAEFEVPADVYQTLSEPLPAVSMWNFAIADCDLPESFVEAVVEVVMSDNARMVNIHGAAEATLPENYDKNTVLMWHPGAAKWFRDNAGAEIPDDMVFSG